jgi:hypothetical protein
MIKLLPFLIILATYAPQAKSQQVFLGLYHGVLNIGKAIPKAIKRNKRLKKYAQLEIDFNEHYLSGEDASYSCNDKLNVLYMNKEQAIPTRMNSLTFRNHDDIYNFKNPFGYCWGHALVTQQLNRLALFRPTLKAPYKEGTRKWKKFYRKKIKKLTKKNQAQIFPGFVNLYQFSSHPYIEQQLANAVQNSWARTAVSIRGLKAGLKKVNTIEGKSKLFKQIKTRIERKQFPLITMHYLGESFTETHIIYLWRYDGEMSPGLHKFCSRDNNSEYKLNEDCKNFLLINYTAQGPVLYKQQKFTDIEGIIFEVGVQLSYSEDTNVVDQVESLSKICNENKL